MKKPALERPTPAKLEEEQFPSFGVKRRIQVLEFLDPSLRSGGRNQLDPLGVETLRQQNKIKYRSRWHLSKNRTEAHEYSFVCFLFFYTMPLGVITSDFDHPADIARAESILESPGMPDDLEGSLGKPFVLREEWPDLLSLGGPDCEGRENCRGCHRLTVSASGLVYTILKNNGTQAVGAVCSTSIQSAPFVPVFFTRSVDRPKL